ncbi:MAG: hypothetical protein KC503_03190 [Myxococcales bacterium]|nr:hypothetical protein [Myxococcales bacterium]
MSTEQSSDRAAVAHDDFAPLMPHGPITKAFDNVYVVQGTVDMAPLVRITRQMAIVVDDGQLTLVNAVRLSPQGEAELTALGEIAHVMHIGTHGMDDAYYVARHGAKLWAPAGAKLPDGLSADELIGPGATLPVAEMTPFLFEHTVDPEAALLLARDGGILLTCDSVQNWESTEGCSLMAKAAARAMGFLRPAQIGPPWRKRMTPAGGSLRGDFERLAALDFAHLVGGHGVPLRDVAKQRFAETIRRVYGA